MGNVIVALFLAAPLLFLVRQRWSLLMSQPGSGLPTVGPPASPGYVPAAILWHNPVSAVRHILDGRKPASILLRSR
jgi:hypothetical protein